MTLRTYWIVLLAGLALAGAAQAQSGFKFSNDAANEQAEKEREAQKKADVQYMLDTPCRAKIKNQKIMVLIGQEVNGHIVANQSSYGTHAEAINRRLRDLGLKTYTQAEIAAQVKQAVIDAYFKNDADAALSASKRMAAQYILRGLITTRAFRNAMANINQVNISMAFTLTGSNGKTISQANAENASYAGQDVTGMALTLLNEKADEVVAQLYSDYCRTTR
jgi:hypothetical protein